MCAWLQPNEDELSVEDESVNRVASMIATIQCQGCVSLVSEKKVVSVLINAVGKEQIDFDVARKVSIALLDAIHNAVHAPFSTCMHHSAHAAHACTILLNGACTSNKN